MIGCYIHHQGLGHLHRSLAWAQQLGEPATGLSSLAKPQDWPGPWVQLEPDWTSSGPAADPTAGGTLHWAPVGHAGLRSRMHGISQWIHQAEPELLVVDVSVEVAVLARLHGVPVVTVALPGDRRDAAHHMGYSLSSTVVGFWPDSARGMLNRDDAGPPVQAVGAVSRFAPSHGAAESGSLRVSILNGYGGGSVSSAAQRAITDALPEAEVRVLGGEHGTWVEDPWAELTMADLIITAAGQNSVAEVATSRTPAVVVAQERPYREQHHTQQSLHSGPWPVVAAPEQDDTGSWRATLDQALTLDGDDWSTWCDGKAAERFIGILNQVRR